MSHEPYSLKGYEPIDSIEQDAPIGHGVQQNFGADTRKTGHGKKSSFWKGKGGRQYARRNDGRIITHDAEALGGDDASLADFNGVESVVVEAPLGHGVTQYYAEGDDPLPPAPADITGQDGPSATPTNSNFSAESFCRKCGRDMGESTVKHDVARCPYNDPDCYTCENCSNHDMCENPDLDYGVTQYYAEGDSPSPTFNEGITGQEGPESNPTNSNFTAQGYNDKQDESIGMRHRGRHSQSRKDRRNEASAMDRRGRRGRKYDDVATMDGSKANFSAANLPSTTAHKRRNARGRFVNQGPTSSRSSPQPKWAKAMFANMGGKNAEHNSEYSQIMGPTVEANEGGLHSPSSFDISWEDGSGQSSASMPPNEIHFGGESLDYGDCDTCQKEKPIVAHVEFDGPFLSALCKECYAEHLEMGGKPNVYDADFTLEKPVKTGFMVAFGAGLFSLAAIAGTVLIGTLLGGNE